ncbi:MAG: sugar nucleotide-binding protein, partial [Aquificaceae bacterium]|nr:sugar nucleotide-binding protein [Aquificaceae bacterium]
IQQTMDRYLIFRTSWVYGKGKQNFLYKLTQWAQTQEYLRIACDEFSVPTSTRTIVDATLRAIEKELTGLYHLVNNGYASRYEWAKEYFRLMGIKKFIYPAYQSDFNLPAKRPRWSVMENGKLEKLLNIEIQEWREELQTWFLSL